MSASPRTCPRCGVLLWTTPGAPPVGQCPGCGVHYHLHRRDRTSVSAAPEPRTPAHADKGRPAPIPQVGIPVGRLQPPAPAGHAKPLPLPPTAAPAPGVSQRYEIIAGERRWRATQLAGLAEIPAIIRDVPDEAAVALALIENIQRENLNPLEEARALHRLITEFDLTHQEAAEAVGRSRVAVSNLLRLLELADEVKTLVEERQLEMGHARALLGLPGAADQIAALEAVQARDLTVRQTEELVRRWVAGEKPAGLRTGTPPGSGSPDAVFQQAFLDGLQRALRTKVTFRPAKEGGGTLTIHYASDEELNAFYERLSGEDLW